MLKACIFPKSVTKWGGFFKVWIVHFFHAYDQIDMYIMWKQIFDGSNIIKWGDNQEHIYLP